MIVINFIMFLILNHKEKPDLDMLINMILQKEFIKLQNLENMIFKVKLNFHWKRK